MINEIKESIKSYCEVDDSLATLLAYIVASNHTRTKVCGMNLNLYVLAVGTSSISHKSSAINRAMDFCEEVYPIGTVSDIEERMSNLHEWQPRVMMLHDDEFGSTMKAFKSGSLGYKKMIDVLNSAYDGRVRFPGYRGKPPKTISDVSLSLVASTTLQSFRETCTKEFLDGGLMKRMLVTMPQRQAYRPKRHMKVVNLKIPKCCDPSIELDDIVWREHDKFMEKMYALPDEALASSWARADASLLKISALNALFEHFYDNGDDGTSVHLLDWIIARDIVTQCVGFQAILRQTVAKK